MKQRAGTISGSLLKWVVIPIGLAALGFYVVGPRVAKSYLASVKTPVITKDADIPETDTPRTTGAPKVQVTSEKLKTSTRRRRTSKPKPDPSEDVVRVNDAPEDPSPEPPSEPDNGTGEIPGTGGNGGATYNGG